MLPKATKRTPPAEIEMVTVGAVAAGDLPACADCAKPAAAPSSSNATRKRVRIKVIVIPLESAARFGEQPGYWPGRPGLKGLQFHISQQCCGCAGAIPRCVGA